MCVYVCGGRLLFDMFLVPKSGTVPASSFTRFSGKKMGSTICSEVSSAFVFFFGGSLVSGFSVCEASLLSLLSLRFFNLASSFAASFSLQASRTLAWAWRQDCYSQLCVCDPRTLFLREVISAMSNFDISFNIKYSMYIEQGDKAL